MAAWAVAVSALVGTAARAGDEPTLEQSLERAARAAAAGIERGLRAAEHGVRLGAAAAARGIERGALATARAAERAARQIERSLPPPRPAAPPPESERTGNTAERALAGHGEA
jgi:hypothetical protein